MLKHLQSSDDWNTKTLSAKGFTLIELLVVIIILGILAGVAIFAIGGIDDNAKKNACQNEKDTVQVAVEAFKTQSATGANPAAGTADLTGANGNLSKAPKYWQSDGSGGVSAIGTLPTGCS